MSLRARDLIHSTTGFKYQCKSCVPIRIFFRVCGEWGRLHELERPSLLRAGTGFKEEIKEIDSVLRLNLSG